jgi:NAD(P)-dependent dehydrogenase (short-subunit alcohol dehydrogenase family)
VKDLDGRVAVVTGGASGIGRAVAALLAVEGMRVVVADVEAERLQATARQVGARGVVTDVRERASVERLSAIVQDEFGRVDLVCNNAGVGPMAQVADLTESDWRWMVDVNLVGVIHGVSVFLPQLLASPHGGHIVNTASIAGLAPSIGMGAYAVTKFGVVALTETLALELEAAGARVGATAFCPGPTRTNIATSSRNRPADESVGGLADVALESVDTEGRRWITADDAAGVLVDAVRGDRLYAITHPEMVGKVADRHRRIERAFQRASAHPNDGSVAQGEGGQHA